MVTRTSLCLRFPSGKFISIYYHKGDYRPFVQSVLDQLRSLLQTHRHIYAKIIELCNALHEVHPNAHPTALDLQTYKLSELVLTGKETWSDILETVYTKDNFLCETLKRGVFIECLANNPNVFDFTVVIDLDHKFGTLNVYTNKPGDYDCSVVCSVGLRFLPHSLLPYFMTQDQQTALSNEIVEQKMMASFTRQ